MERGRIAEDEDREVLIYVMNGEGRGGRHIRGDRGVEGFRGGVEGVRVSFG